MEALRMTHSAAIFPGTVYRTSELKDVLAPQMDEVSSVLKEDDRESFSQTFGDSFFDRLGVRTRSLSVDPGDSESWWQAERGKHPIASAGADVYLKLMRDRPPLGEKDKLIVVSNVFDTTVPNVVAYVISEIEKRNSNFVRPLQLSLMGEGCSGFISGLREAQIHLAAYPGSRVAVVSSEISSPYFYSPELLGFFMRSIDQSNPDRDYYLSALKGLFIQRFLFGDAAVGVMCAGADHSEGGMVLNQFTRWSNLNPSDIDLFGIRGIGTKGVSAPPFGYFYQDAKGLFSRLKESYIPSMKEELDTLVQKSGQKPDGYAIHMGSGPILEMVCEGFGIPRDLSEPSVRVLSEHGNMNTASGAAVIDRFLNKSVLPSQLFLAFFGVGFTAQVAYRTGPPEC